MIFQEFIAYVQFGSMTYFQGHPSKVKVRH